MLGSEAGGVNTHSTADDWILGFLQSNQIYLLFMSVMPVIKGRSLSALYWQIWAVECENSSNNITCLKDNLLRVVDISNGNFCYFINSLKSWKCSALFRDQNLLSF